MEALGSLYPKKAKTNLGYLVKRETVKTYLRKKFPSASGYARYFQPAFYPKCYVPSFESKYMEFHAVGIDFYHGGFRPYIPIPYHIVDLSLS